MGFPVEKIPPVVGKHNLPELTRVHEIIRQCAMSIRDTRGCSASYISLNRPTCSATLTNIPYHAPPHPTSVSKTDGTRIRDQVTSCMILMESCILRKQARCWAMGHTAWTKKSVPPAAYGGWQPSRQGPHLPVPPTTYHDPS
jgi:hypothetical protein